MDFVVANSVEINTLDDDDEYVTAEFYGHVRGKIVGIRYYNGLVYMNFCTCVYFAINANKQVHNVINLYFR